MNLSCLKVVLDEEIDYDDDVGYNDEISDDSIPVEELSLMHI